MTLKQITKEYNDLIASDFSPSLEKIKAAQNLIKKNANKIDFVLDEPNDIFYLISIMLSRNDTISFKVLIDSGYDINTVNEKFETVLTRAYGR